MGKRRSKALELRRRIVQGRAVKRRNIARCRVPLICPKCYHVTIRVITRPKSVVWYVRCFDPNCDFRLFVPKHPTLKKIDAYNQACDYYRKGIIPLYKYKQMKRKTYERIMDLNKKELLVGKVVVEVFID